MDVKQLADLQEIAQAQFDRDALELSEALARERKLSDELDALAESQARRAEAQRGDLDIAFAQTGATTWQTWATARRKELLTYLAHQRAVTAQVKMRAQASFGRNAALLELAEKGRKAQLEATEKAELQSLVDLELGRRWMTVPDRGQTS